MSQKEINKIKQEVKEKALAKIRNQWFKEYRERKNAKAVCEKFVDGPIVSSAPPESGGGNGRTARSILRPILY